MIVPLVQLDRQHATLIDDLRAAFERVLAADAFILGEEVASFEEDFATYCGVAHCVGTASGTAALTLALSAAGVGPGDDVIVPGHTFIASALAVVNAGATPVFCDVDERTGLMDPAAAEAAIGGRTAALLPVHLYGQVCDMDPILALAERHGLLVVEDSAQAHGASYRGRRAGSLGTAAGFSFYPSKNLGALGDGGAVCTDDPQLAQRVRELRDMGRRSRDDFVVSGMNERLDGLQAAFLRVKLPHLDTWNAARRRAAMLYRDLLADSVGTLHEDLESRCVYHLFPVRLDRRDAIASELRAAGIGVGIHYAPAAYEQPVMRQYYTGELPVATRWALEELSLPISESIRPDEQERVAAACKTAVGDEGWRENELVR